MSCVSPRLAAGLLGLALPSLITVVDVIVAVPQAAAQDMVQPETAPDPGRRRSRRSRGRERAAPSEKAEKKPALPPGMQQATPVATFGDWNVFTNGQGRSRMCYAIAQPQTRTPKTLPRDTGYLFVTVRKGENVQNEIAVMFGFKPKLAASQVKAGAAAAPNDPYLTVGTARYGLVVKDENAWIQNQAEESRIVAEMSKTEKATVKTISMRGSATSDDYALAGFADAMKKAREECK